MYYPSFSLIYDITFFWKINYQKSYKIVVAESLIINADKMENVCKLNAKRIYLYESDFY